MRTLALKPGHKRISAYHASLADFAKLGVKHETAVRAAFQALLEDCTSLVNKGRADKWKLVPEYSLKTKAGAKITPDGALLDSFRLIHGLWEAKDTADDLDKEIRAKFKLGYPRDNILFQAPTRAVLVQDGERVLDRQISSADNLVEVLRGFFEYQAPAFDQWEKGSPGAAALGRRAGSEKRGGNEGHGSGDQKREDSDPSLWQHAAAGVLRRCRGWDPGSGARRGTSSALCHAR